MLGMTCLMTILTNIIMVQDNFSKDFSQYSIQFFMTMIKPKLTLFKMKIKVWFMNASKLGRPSLGDAPEVLDAVPLHLPPAIRPSSQFP